MKKLVKLISIGVILSAYLSFVKSGDVQNVKEKELVQGNFEKVVLTSGTLFEPLEMAVLPNLDILVVQRRGEIMLYKNNTSEIRQVGFLNVYHKRMGNIDPGEEEEGLLGIAADPDFEKNNFIYLFYSAYDTSLNRLSRFRFENDTIDNRSERIILEFYSQREMCCHTGGSIAFGRDGLLYVSTGDNTTPFDVPAQQHVNNGYAPLDNRKGLEQYDARRSAGNTNDLRGKILRIRIKKDGAYTIPDGNLFPPGTSGTRPEIYVMGNRNPYRLSVDRKKGYLYWGEIGPDASKDNPARGPKGYDEINQARSAGFYGWPFFVGNNFPYRQFDYTNGLAGSEFDPVKPENNSENNNGIKILPPAKPSFIWYAFDSSLQFNSVGKGGRAAMAGPVYYSRYYPRSTRYPKFLDGKLFIYDWVRSCINVVTMKKNGDYESMAPFMKNTTFASPIDMEVGPDGKIYVLEYGKGWYSKNPDAAISRIDYNENQRSTKISDTIDLQNNLPEALIKKSDCNSCHHIDNKSIGPSFTSIAERFRNKPDSRKMVADKIIKGTKGEWGTFAMPPHPDLSTKEAQNIAAWILALQSKPGNASRKPNIIFILTDDLGYGDLSCYGQKKFNTPRLDKMAAEGVRFTQHYAGSTVCAPSRASLMTGFHTGHTRIRGNYELGPHGSGAGLELLPEELTVAELLKNAGYRTAHIGKWSLGVENTTGEPTRQGFDYAFGFLNQNHAHFYYTDYLFRNGKRVEVPANANGQRKEYVPDIFTSEALKYIEESRDQNKPFFLYIAYTTPHAELLHPDDTIFRKFKGKFPETPYVLESSGKHFDDSVGNYNSQETPLAAFAAMVTRLDMHIGMLIDQLKKAGIDENTIMFFSSDNGPHNEGGADPVFFNSSGPLRGIKRDLYEGGIRVPFIVRWPGTIKPGSISNLPSAFWDFMPTAAELAGTPISNTDGISMVPELLGNSKNQLKHKYLYWEFHENKSSDQAILNGDWKGVRKGPNKPLELYNLKIDIGEKKNVASDHAEIVQEMEQQLKVSRTPSEIWPLKN